MSVSVSVRRFLFDVESTSTVDLKTAGPAAYWEDPNTRVLCVCYQVDDGPVETWLPGDAVPVPVLSPPRDRDDFSLTWRVVAHNYLFEFYAWWFKLGPVYNWPLPHPDLWDCTMARCLYWGLPAKLEHVCQALKLPIQIDPGKNARIQRTARPRTLNPLTWWHETEPARLAQLVVDCQADVAAEAALDSYLPPIPPRERAIWRVDGRINRRGIQVDLDLVHRLEAITRAESARLNARMASLTHGRVTSTNQVGRIMAELRALDCAGVAPIADLAKGTLADALTHKKLCPLARDILLTRQEAAKASTGKLKAMVAGASSDGRCRAMFQYGGAGRTLRWSGRRVQPQNYPRGAVPKVRSVFPLVQMGAPVEDLSALVPGGVLDAVSAMLRGCLVASPGRSILSGDFSQIEARVIAWLAGQGDILDVFARGEDVYTYTAAAIGSQSRQLGKVLVLACGYGMGPATFQDTAKTYGLDLTLSQAEAAVDAWRQLNTHIVSLWWDVDRIVRRVAQSPHGTSETRGRLVFTKSKRSLRITLPSGRQLTYQDITVEPDGFGQWDLSYWGVHPKVKTWSKIRTWGARLVENATQAVARDVMAEAMLRLDYLDFDLIGTVHDELIAEEFTEHAPDRLDQMLEVMREPPVWAQALPVDAAGWFGPRYGKG